MQPIKLVVISLAVVALTATGCGKSSKAESSGTAATTSTAAASTTPASTTVPAPSGKPLTRAELVKAGEAICAHLNAELEATPVNIKSKLSLDRALPLAAAYERTEYDELAKLTPPAELASAWKTFVEETLIWVNDVAGVVKDVNENNQAATNRMFVTGARVHEHLAAVIKRAGFKECAAS